VASQHVLGTFREGPAFDRARRDRIADRVRELVSTTGADDDGRRPFDREPELLTVVTGPDDGGAADPRRVRSRHPLAAAASVLVLVVAVSAAAAFLGRAGSELDGLTVDELAQVARHAEDRPLAEGEYGYHAEERRDAAGPEAVVLTERWIGADGSSRERTTTPAAPGATAIPEPSAEPPPGALPSDPAPMSYAEVRALPSDAPALLDRLTSQGGVGDEPTTDTIVDLGELLSLEVTPPAVRGAAIEALHLLGGEVRHLATDARGRRGVAVSGRLPDGTSWTVIVDPATGRALAVSTPPPWSGPRPSPTPSWRLWFPGR
jgi:hypothetical protein